MPEILGSVLEWIANNNATCIDPLPRADPNQRGPTCGFYALAFVMAYWQGKDASLPALPARTNNLQPTQSPHSATDRESKQKQAGKGAFSSLRQYGKFYNLTSYGSVFNAENIVKVAQGAGASYGGHYTGQVFTTTSVQDFVTKVKTLIGKDCPVIVPFDVGDTGDPELHTGKRAHWTVICGWCERENVVWFLHRHWGKYRESKGQDFALSCQSLSSNALLEFEKAEVKNGDGKVIKRDWMTADSINNYKQRKYNVQSLNKKGMNLEFTDPENVRNLPQHIPNPNEDVIDKAKRSAWNLFASTPYDTPNICEELKKHGFQPANLENNGLRRRIVAVYPQGAGITAG